MIRYVMTEAANVTRFLSFGCLGPSVLHGDRYRRDISAEFGGAMVLLADPSEAAAVVLETNDAMPVAIEVDDLFRSDDVVIVTGSLVPVLAVRRLHFRSKKEMTEFRSIGYQNVDPAVFDCAVTPALFQPSQAPESERTPAVAQVSLEMDAAPSGAADAPVEIITADRIERLDRLAGALSAVVMTGMPTRALVENMANTMVAAMGALEPIEEVFSRNFVPSAERSLHEAICETLISLPHSETGHERLLADIVRRHESFEAQALVIEDMLRAKRDLDPKAVEGACGRALLTALAQLSPEEVAAARGDGAPSGQERPIAQWYAGLRRGGARRPIASRMAIIEPLIQRWLAAQGSAGQPPHLPESPKKIDVDARVGSSAFEYRYVIDGQPSGPILRPFPSDLERVSAAVREHWRTAVHVADAIGVTVTTMVHLNGPSDIHIEASPFTIRIDTPHRLDRKVEPEEVIRALAAVDSSVLSDLVHRYADTPDEAP